MSHYDKSEVTFACYICSDSHYDRCGPLVCVKIKNGAVIYAVCVILKLMQSYSAPCATYNLQQVYYDKVPISF